MMRDAYELLELKNKEIASLRRQAKSLNEENYKLLNGIENRETEMAILKVKMKAVAKELRKFENLEEIQTLADRLL